MRQEVRAGVKWRHTALLHSGPIRSERLTQNPRAGSLDPAKADDSSWDSSDPVCLGIAELSRQAMARGTVRPTR
jgi:hypothetical protein